MAGTSRISGFDATSVRNGLRLAMQVGLPVNTADQPTFFMPQVTVAPTEPLDQEGVPFDPSYRPTRTRTSVTAPCAIEYQDGSGKLENFGVIAPTKVVLTLLDQDYLKVKGFEYVVISGTRFFYQRTETAKGLVTVGLYKIHCLSEDEG